MFLMTEIQPIRFLVHEINVVMFRGGQLYDFLLIFNSSYDMNQSSNKQYYRSR